MGVAGRTQPLLLTGHRQDSGFPIRLSLPTVAPGPIPGALRFVSLALHILPHSVEGAAGAFQRGKFPNRDRIGNALKSSLQVSRTAHSKTHSTLQAWMNSRNQINITTAGAHRQPVFSHPN